MGSVSYGYSGKGSSSYSSYSEPEKTTKLEKSPMEDMLNLLGIVEQNRRLVKQRRENVSNAEKELIKAENSLKNNEQKVMMQLEKLDPETKDTLRRMMNGLNRTDGNIIFRDGR